MPVSTIVLSKGDSCTINVIVDADVIADVNEVVLSLGNAAVGSYLAGEVTKAENVFEWKIKSNITAMLGEDLALIVAVDLGGYGVRKSKLATAPRVSFVNSSSHNAASTSDFIDLTVTYNVIEEELVADEIFLNAFRGKSALELFRIEKNLPNATFDDMMVYYLPRRSVAINNVGDGAIITHNLGGPVITRFVDAATGEIVNNVRGVFLTDNSVTLRTPILDDLLNQNFNGKLICERY